MYHFCGSFWPEENQYGENYSDSAPQLTSVEELNDFFQNVQATFDDSVEAKAHSQVLEAFLTIMPSISEIDRYQRLAEECPFALKSDKRTLSNESTNCSATIAQLMLDQYRRDINDMQFMDVPNNIDSKNPFDKTLLIDAYSFQLGHYLAQIEEELVLPHCKLEKAIPAKSFQLKLDELMPLIEKKLIFIDDAKKTIKHLYQEVIAILIDLTLQIDALTITGQAKSIKTNNKDKSSLQGALGFLQSFRQQLALSVEIMFSGGACNSFPLIVSAEDIKAKCGAHFTPQAINHFCALTTKFASFPLVQYYQTHWQKPNYDQKDKRETFGGRSFCDHLLPTLRRNYLATRLPLLSTLNRLMTKLRQDAFPLNKALKEKKITLLASLKDQLLKSYDASLGFEDNIRMSAEITDTFLKGKESETLSRLGILKQQRKWIKGKTTGDYLEEALRQLQEAHGITRDCNDGQQNHLSDKPDICSTEAKIPGVNRNSCPTTTVGPIRGIVCSNKSVLGSKFKAGTSTRVSPS